MIYNHQQIRCFLEVAETANFTETARRLFMTTTAVSKQIKNLEQALNEQLFIRTTRNVILTEFGSLFYTRCKEVETQINKLAQFVESKKDSPEGELRVLVSTITAKSYFLKVLPEFCERFPGVELNVYFSEEDNELGRLDIDVMIGFPTIPPFTEALCYRNIMFGKNILCASPAFIERYGCPDKAEDLPKFKFISHTLRKPALFLPLNDGKQIYCGKPFLYMNNFNALNQACLDGMGLFLTGDLLVSDHLKTGKLVQLLKQYSFKEYEIYLFYRKYDYELPKIRAFVDFFTDKMT